MKYSKLSLILISLSISLIGITIASCDCDTTNTISQSQSTDMGTSAKDTLAMEQGYIDSFIFLGESTTYHMINRGVLPGGKNTTQVWGTVSGTLNLDTSISSARIIYPETKEKMTIAEAIAKKKPEYIVLTFGLNGAVQKINKGKDYFKDCYKILINTIKNNSPSTKIIIQSAFPVARNMDMTNYSIDAATLNRYIDKINLWSKELSVEEGLFYVNSAEVLKDSEGFLLYEYQAGDGHHLTASAYEAILTYLKEHPYNAEAAK